MNTCSKTKSYRLPKALAAASLILVPTMVFNPSLDGKSIGLELVRVLAPQASAASTRNELSQGGILIRCDTRKDDFEVFMTATNTGQAAQTCTATCYFRINGNDNNLGSLTGTQTIAPGATDEPFATNWDPNNPNTTNKYGIVNPGFADCS